MKKIFSVCRIAALLLMVFTLLLGVVYPVFILGGGQLLFPAGANGSLLTKGDKIVGSELLGQGFTQPKYFWSRPSATHPPYNAAASGASNLSPANPKLLEAVKARVAALQQAQRSEMKIPVDLLTASASGLDPHISIAAAQYQVPRVAQARRMKESDVTRLIEQHTGHWLGESYVNVLRLNMALDARL